MTQTPASTAEPLGLSPPSRRQTGSLRKAPRRRRPEEPKPEGAQAGDLPGGPRAEAGSPHQVGSAPQTRARRGPRPPGPPGQHSRAPAERAEHGPGPAAARSGHGGPGSANEPERPAPVRPCRESTEADKRGRALPWASRPAPLPSAADGETAGGRDNSGAPAEGRAAAPSAVRSGGQRAAPRAPAPRRQLLPLLTLLPRCAAAAPRRL